MKHPCFLMPRWLYHRHQPAYEGKLQLCCVMRKSERATGGHLLLSYIYPARRSSGTGLEANTLARSRARASLRSLRGYLVHLFGQAPPHPL